MMKYLYRIRMALALLKRGGCVVFGENLPGGGYRTWSMTDDRFNPTRVA